METVKSINNANGADDEDTVVCTKVVTPERSQRGNSGSGNSSNGGSGLSSRPIKRKRASPRLRALKQKEEEENKKKKKKGNENDDVHVDVIDVDFNDDGGVDGRAGVGGRDDGTQPHEGSNNGYYEVDEILERRTRNYGSDSINSSNGGAGVWRQVVEYLVSWKRAPSGEVYEPSWLIAENLDREFLLRCFFFSSDEMSCVAHL